MPKNETNTYGIKTCSLLKTLPSFAKTDGSFIPGGQMGNLCKANATAAPSESSIAALYADNCGRVKATLVPALSGVTGTDCSWTATYTYTIEDECENFAANAVIVFTGGDTGNPV